MIEIFVTMILIAFMALFVMMALPMKDEAAKLNQNTKPNNNASEMQHTR